MPVTGGRRATFREMLFAIAGCGLAASPGPGTAQSMMPLPFKMPSLIDTVAGGSPPRRASPIVMDDVAVHVIAIGTAPRLAPPGRWRPPAETGSDLRLDHRAGEPLDAGWVERQFAANGPGSIDRALALVQLVNRAYLTAGYVNSGLIVAEQDDPGNLQLHLIFGRLAAADGRPQLSVVFGSGHSAGLDEDFVRRRMPSARQQPLNTVEIERDFRLLADDPAVRTVDAEILPGVRPGEAGMRLTVVPQQRFDLYASAANSRSPSVGGERIAIGGMLRNGVAPGDLLTGDFGMTRGLKDATLGYALPVFSPDTTLSFRGSVNAAAVVDRPLVPLDIRSRDRAAEIGLARRILAEPLTPLGESRWAPARSLSAGLLVATRQSRSFLLGEPFSFAPGSVDGRSAYTAARVTTDYLVRNVHRVFAVSGTVSVGLDGTRSTEPSIPTPDRHFISALLQMNYARKLGEGGLELRARLSGQVANSILYSAERLSTGGSASVRGYRENLFLTDRGVIGSLELVQPLSLSGRTRAPGITDWGAFSIAGFVDGAIVGNTDGPAPTPGSIYSIGATIAWTPSDAISASIGYGKALKHVTSLGTRNLEDRGVHFSILIYPLKL